MTPARCTKAERWRLSSALEVVFPGERDIRKESPAMTVSAKGESFPGRFDRRWPSLFQRKGPLLRGGGTKSKCSRPVGAAAGPSRRSTVENLPGEAKRTSENADEIDYCYCTSAGRGAGGRSSGLRCGPRSCHCGRLSWRRRRAGSGPGGTRGMRATTE